MISKARLSLGLGTALAAGGALLAASPVASADTLPTPDPPTLVSATVTKCPSPAGVEGGYQGFCQRGQSGELILEYKDAPLPPGSPSGAYMSTYFYANGKILNEYNETFYDPGNGARGIGFPICSSGAGGQYPCNPSWVATLQGNEVMTATDQVGTGNADDNNVQTGPQSAPSNGLVPTRR